MESAAIHSSGVHEVDSKTYPSFLTLKEGSTFLTKPLFPQEREDVTALRCSEPLRSKVGGPKLSAPGCAGWDRLAKGGDRLCWSYYGLL